MSKRIKKGLKIAGIAIVAIIAIMILIPFLFKGKIKEAVLLALNENLNAKVVIEDFGLNLFSNFPNATLSLSDVSVIGVDEFASDTLLQAKSASVTIDLSSLFGGNYRISKIDLDRATVNAKVAADEKVNWDIVKTDSTSAQADTDESSAFSLQLKLITIKDCNITYEGLAANMKASIQGWNGSVKGDFSASETTLETKSIINEITFIKDGIPFLNKVTGVADAKLNANFDDMKFTFNESNFKLNELGTSIDGSVKYIEEGNFDFDLRLKAPTVDFKQILSLIPSIYTNDFKTIQTSGEVSLSAYVVGEKKMEEEIFPAIDLRLTVNNAMFKYPSLPRSVDNIDLILSVNGEGGSIDNLMVLVDKFSFTLGGNPFKGSFRMTPAVNDKSIKFNAEGKLDLAMIKDVYPLPEGTELNGNVEADIRVATTSSAIEKEQYDKVSAEGHIKLINMGYKSKEMPDLLIKNALLEFTPRYVNLTGFDATLGESDLKAAGKLENFVAYIWKDQTLKGNLSLQSRYLNLDQLMGEEQSASEESDEQTSDIVIPKNIDFLLDVSLTHVLFKEISITNLSGTVSVKDGILSMKNVGASALGGLANISGVYNTSDPKNPIVDFDLGLTRMSFAETFKHVEAVQKFAPIFEDVLGTYSMGLKFNTSLKSTVSETLRSLTGSGALQTSDVRLEGNRTIAALGSALKTDKLDNISPKDLNLPFTIENGGLTTSPFKVNFGDGGEMMLSGTTRLDQTIDYKGEIKLPASLDNKYLKKVPITITGSFASPKIGVDVKAAITDAVGSVVGDLLGVKGDGDEAVDLGAKLSEEKAKQIIKIREEADKAADKLVATAKEQGDAMVKKVGNNKLAQAAAKGGAKKLVEEAEKQAQNLRDKAEEQIKKLEGEEANAEEAATPEQ